MAAHATLRWALSMAALLCGGKASAMDPIPGISSETIGKLATLEQRHRAGDKIDLDQQLTAICSGAELAALATSGRGDLSAPAMQLVVARGATLDAASIDRLLLALDAPASGEWICTHAAEAIARSVGGARRLQSVMRGTGNATGRVCAAVGLRARESAISEEERLQARRFVVEAIGNEDDSARVAANALPIDDWTQRAILDRLAKPPVPQLFLDRGLTILAQGSSLRAERKAVLFANLRAPTVMARQSVVNGLMSLGLTQQDIAQYHLIARDEEPHVRRLMYGAFANAPQHWMTPLLLEGLNDSLGESRLYCARALGNLKEKKALAALVDLLQRGLATHDGFPTDAREAGNAIASIAGLKGYDFAERLESFPGGLMRVENPEQWRKDAQRLLDWWQTKGKNHSGAVDSRSSH